MVDLTDDDEGMRDLLAQAHTIAVVGASADPARASNGIFAYLQGSGYDAVPVTPKPHAVHGREPLPDLASVAAQRPSGIDIVDIFRARDHTPGVVREAIAAGAKAVWFQLGTDHPGAVAAALDAGLDVVADRCILVEHRRLIGT